MAMWDYYHVFVAHGSGSITCIFIMGSRHLSTGNLFFFKQSEMESWFVQLGEASPLLAWLGWPVLDWKNTTDSHEMQHTINGHLLWITHSKMSTRLQAATFLLFAALEARRRTVTITKPLQLYMSMHHSWAGNNVHYDSRKTGTL